MLLAQLGNLVVFLSRLILVLALPALHNCTDFRLIVLFLVFGLAHNQSQIGCLLLSLRYSLFDHLISSQAIAFQEILSIEQRATQFFRHYHIFCDVMLPTVVEHINGSSYVSLNKLLNIIHSNLRVLADTDQLFVGLCHPDENQGRVANLYSIPVRLFGQWPQCFNQVAF